MLTDLSWGQKFFFAKVPQYWSSFFKKYILFFITLGGRAPPLFCDEKPSTFLGQKWSIQEVKIFESERQTGDNQPVRA